jgi:hypothetical protein
MSIYEDNGYANRKEYLECLAEECELDYKIVKILADDLGKDEDFNSLPMVACDYALSLTEDDIEEEEYDDVEIALELY